MSPVMSRTNIERETYQKMERVNKGFLVLWFMQSRLPPLSIALIYLIKLRYSMYVSCVYFSDCERVYASNPPSTIHHPSAFYTRDPSTRSLHPIDPIAHTHTHTHTHAHTHTHTHSPNRLHLCSSPRSPVRWIASAPPRWQLWWQTPRFGIRERSCLRR